MISRESRRVLARCFSDSNRVRWVIAGGSNQLFYQHLVLDMDIPEQVKGRKSPRSDLKMKVAVSYVVGSGLSSTTRFDSIDEC